MKYLILSILILVSYGPIAQVPVADIEGRLSISLPSDSSSIHIGKGAGLNQDFAYRRFNTFIGSLAGRKNTYGASNTFVGTGSGQENISGYSNSFLGMEAGNKNETGIQNTFMGFRSGISNISGSHNSFFGADSGYYINGNENVLLGYRSGWRTNGSGNIFIGHFAGPNSSSQTTTTILNNQLYIHNSSTPQPLIYGEFDNNLLRINGQLDVENQSIFMRNLGGADNNHGIKWGESADLPAFGMTYDGTATGDQNRLHIKQYIESPSVLLTIKADGNVGIDANDPMSKLEVNGKVNIGDDTNTPQAGDLRFNSSTNDFEGYDGTNWYSLTGKNKTYTLYLGTGELVSDKGDNHAIDYSTSYGYTTFTEAYGSFGDLFCPLQLPVGATITEVQYMYKDGDPDDDISFALHRYDKFSDGNDKYYQYTTTGVTEGTSTEWRPITINNSHTITSNFYAFFLRFTRDSGAEPFDALKVKYIRVTYTLP